MVTRDTQKSRKIDIYGYGGLFFLTFGFKDEMYNSIAPQLI